LSEGFDLHHIDGNHANNDPLNLVLIYHPDHMMLHGRDVRTLGIRRLQGDRDQRKQRLALGKQIYEERVRSREVWRVLWGALGDEAAASRDDAMRRAYEVARAYAFHAQKPWPIPASAGPSPNRLTQEQVQKRIAEGKVLYDMRASTGDKWRVVWARAFPERVYKAFHKDGSKAMNLARLYAESEGRPWPIPV
jgi:hypothetical protein